MTTANRDMDTSKYVLVNSIKLLESNPESNILGAFPAHTFEKKLVRYNMIIGHDFCKYVNVNLILKRSYQLDWKCNKNDSIGLSFSEIFTCNI